MTRPDIVNTVMNEHVRVLGFPQVVVTRAWLYRWLRRLGWDTRERGVASLDYIAFGRAATGEPLTEDEERDRLLGMVEDSYRREAA